MTSAGLVASVEEPELDVGTAKEPDVGPVGILAKASSDLFFDS